MPEEEEEATMETATVAYEVDQEGTATLRLLIATGKSAQDNRSGGSERNDNGDSSK